MFHESSSRQRVAEKWLSLQQPSAADCANAIVTVLRVWPYFGAKIFDATVSVFGFSVYMAGSRRTFVSAEMEVGRACADSHLGHEYQYSAFSDFRKRFWS